MNKTNLQEKDYLLQCINHHNKYKKIVAKEMISMHALHIPKSSNPLPSDSANIYYF